MGGKPSKGTKRDHRLKENKAGMPSKTVKATKVAFKGAAKPFGK